MSVFSNVFIIGGHDLQNHDILINSITSKILQYIQQGKHVFATSSFQTQSIVLLHILSQLKIKIPIYFINTGFHYVETLEFKDIVAKRFNLEVIDILPSVPKSEQINFKGELLYISDPERCCQVNKVEPLRSIINQFDVWISGIRRDQTKNRSLMKEEEITSDGILRYHPLLEWSEHLIKDYIDSFDLPRHPLATNVAMSIGCEPCTNLIGSDELISGRSMRWSGSQKTECGLHTELRSPY